MLSSCAAATDRQGRELTEHGTALFPLACYQDELSKNPVPWHWHDELEAFWVEAGRAVLCVEGERRALVRGEGCFINAGALHSVEEGGADSRLRSLVFHPRLVGGSVESIFWQGYLRPILEDSSFSFVCLDSALPWQREGLEAIEAAWRCCALEPPGYEFQAREALSRLIFLLSEHRPAVRSAPSEKSLRDTRRLKAMLQFVQEHLGEELTVERIAESASLSESECLRCFRAVIGAAPIQYVRQLRVQRAAELLAVTDRKISEIGALCGFQEMSYFSKTFRTLKGCTPSEYRARKKG